MIGWTILMAGIMLLSVVVVLRWKQRKAAHIAYWQQQWEVEQRKGEAASRLPDSPARRQKVDHAMASMERIDGELSRLTGSQRSVGHQAS